MSTSIEAPALDGDALAAVRHRGSHMQIIAAAGSGKTEVVSQRVADLLAGGVPARGIVAFTFTERSAKELAARIAARVEGRLGRGALDLLGGLFVGTIHAYCFRLLQQRVAKFETYDVLDDNQLTAFLSREATHLGIRALDDKNRMFAAIKTFLDNVAVVENELLDASRMPDPFRTILCSYYQTLDRYRLLTYGQQIVRAVEELGRPEIAELVHADLRHLIVDEYQDVNPAQEKLIKRLLGPDTELCVVGDDDQAIYQWRGSDVSNIVSFSNRYPNVATFELVTNRRSRPQIIEAANGFAQTIPGRLSKQMLPHRGPGPTGAPEVVAWTADTELDEAGWIVQHIIDLAEDGVRYKDMAVLVRGRVAYRKLLEQFATFAIPVQPGGRTGLFDMPEAVVLGHTFAWIAKVEWRDPYGPPRTITDEGLVEEYAHVFALDGLQARAIRKLLLDWKSAAAQETRTANLVGELYELLDVLNARTWSDGDAQNANRLGTMARFSSLLADYEAVRRRARTDDQAAGEQVGGQDRGVWYYKNLAVHIVNYAQGAYEGFDGEASFDLDAVDLTTIHRAKGLEWPVVFLPSLTKGRFPTKHMGTERSWLIPREFFAPARYEGSDPDERRLFYVAMTRARDWFCASRHVSVNTRASKMSPYYQDLKAYEVAVDAVVFPKIEETQTGGEEALAISFSELAAFLECGTAFRLRNLVGFQPRLAPELGYGKAIHHVLRAVAEATKRDKQVPTTREIEAILDSSFFLPTANKAAHRQLKASAGRLITSYATEHAADLFRVWETERPFELYLEGVVVRGRADVILDHEGGVATALAIVDYKTSTTGDVADNSLQLQVYTDAGRREGLDIRGAYIHDLKATSRAEVCIDQQATADAEQVVLAAADLMRERSYTANPGPQCRKCEVRTICTSALR